MADSMFTKVAVLAGAAGVGYYLFRSQLHAAYPGIFGPGVASDVLDVSVQSQLIAKAKAAGMTAEAIQAGLNQYVTAKATCAGIWSPLTGTCSSAPTTSTSSSAASTTTTNTTTTSPAPAQANGVRARILAAAGVQTANLDVWSYYYQQVSGSSISPTQMDAIISAAGGNRDTAVTLDAFVAAAAAAGVIPSNLSGAGVRTAGRRAWRY